MQIANSVNFEFPAVDKTANGTLLTSNYLLLRQFPVLYCLLDSHCLLFFLHLIYFILDFFPKKKDQTLKAY